MHLEPVSTDRLWTREFVLALLANFFLAIVFYMLMTTMAVYAVDRFSASDAQAGLAASLFIVGATLSRPIAGRYLDVIGRRRLLLASLGLYLLAGLAYFAAGGLFSLFAVRLIHGFAFGCGTTVVIVSVQSALPMHRRGEGIGFFGMSTPIAAALGPFVALLLSNRVGFTFLFGVASAMALGALLIGFVLQTPAHALSEAEKAGLREHRLANFVEPRALPASLVILAVGMGYSSVLTFLGPFARANGLVGAASAYFLVYSGVVFASRFVVGRVQDRYGDNVVILPAILSLGLGLVILSRSFAAWHVLASAVFVGFGFGTLMTSLQAIAAGSASLNRMGLATSTFFICADVGIGIGPILWGMSIPWCGYRNMYLLAGASMLFVVCLYQALHGRKQGTRAISRLRSP